MAKLYFKYGAMGSSKTAQALITKFNYEEKGMRVWLVKPAKEDRDGARVLRSRIGLDSVCTPIPEDADVVKLFLEARENYDCIIADECQFFTAEQIDGFRTIVNEHDVPVLCFGLRSDFKTRLFEFEVTISYYCYC